MRERKREKKETEEGTRYEEIRANHTESAGDLPVICRSLVSHLPIISQSSAGH